MTQIIGAVVLWGFAAYGAYTAWCKHQELREKAERKEKE